MGRDSESFVVPKGDEEGSEDWHESMWGMALGEIARDLSSGARVVDDPKGRLKTARFTYQANPTKRKRRSLQIPRARLSCDSLAPVRRHYLYSGIELEQERHDIFRHGNVVPVPV